LQVWKWNILSSHLIGSLTAYKILGFKKFYFRNLEILLHHISNCCMKAPFFLSFEVCRISSQSLAFWNITVICFLVGLFRFLFWDSGSHFLIYKLMCLNSGIFSLSYFADYFVFSFWNSWQFSKFLVFSSLLSISVSFALVSGKFSKPNLL
jgi:hypothetical protein